jgi:penicillin G amidase
MADPLDEFLDVARKALPPVEGELAVAGLGEPVEVLRDRWGTPYLSAASQDDLWFAQGFVQASERLFQIELALRAANGRLSEWFSDLTVPADRFARTVGFHRIGTLEADRWTDPSRAMVRRFVEGARAWVASMPAPPVEHALLGVAPELPEELGPWAAGLAYVAWGLSGNWASELLRRQLEGWAGKYALKTFLPPIPPTPPEVIAGSNPLPRAGGQGSNNWVVAGSRTASGKPLLANDPHLLVQQPAAWFEVHLRAPGYEARGVAFPFLPGVVIGTTAHHAWGLTNVSGDVQDLYVERLNGEGDAARFDDAWQPILVHRERLDVRGGEGVDLEVRETRHGPILETVPVGVAGSTFEPLEGDTTFALRWTATDGLLEPAMLVEIAQATSFETFREALRGVTCPGQNVVYADLDGTIGYQCTGCYPVRRSGDGTVPVPGWTSDHEWDGFVPFEELPWSKDPSSGYVATANHRVYDEDYPHLIGLDFHPPFRAERIAELLRSNEQLTVADCGSIQVDTLSIPARRLLPLLTRIPPKSDRTRDAVARLAAWDGNLRADSWEAAVYEVWVGAIAERLFFFEGPQDHRESFAAYFAWREPFVCSALPSLLASGRAPPTGGQSLNDLVAGALEETLQLLERDLGDPDTWRWGALHRVRFAHPLARLPGIGALFVAAEHDLGGDEQTVLQGGFDARLGFDAVVVPSWRVVVDLADLDGSLAVLTTGQSGNPASPHWNDQSELWASGKLRACPFSRPAVEAAAEHALLLVPG